jgi:hypothetical protein
MGKRFFSILGTVGLATGLVLGTGVRSAAAAGEGRRSAAASAGHNDDARHDSYWVYYACFYQRRDAEDCCRQLHHEHPDWQCKIKHENNRWCVYIHRNH